MRDHPFDIAPRVLTDPEREALLALIQKHLSFFCMIFLDETPQKYTPFLWNFLSIFFQSKVEKFIPLIEAVDELYTNQSDASLVSVIKTARYRSDFSFKIILNDLKQLINEYESPKTVTQKQLFPALPVKKKKHNKIIQKAWEKTALRLAKLMNKYLLYLGKKMEDKAKNPAVLELKRDTLINLLDGLGERKVDDDGSSHIKLKAYQQGSEHKSQDKLSFFESNLRVHRNSCIQKFNEVMPSLFKIHSRGDRFVDACQKELSRFRVRAKR